VPGAPTAVEAPNARHLFTDGDLAMADVSTLITRIDAELSGLDDKIKRAQAEGLEEHHERQERLKAFEQRLETLPEVWKPRLEALINRFGDRAKATPHITSSSREVTVGGDRPRGPQADPELRPRDHSRPHSIRLASASGVAARRDRREGDWGLVGRPNHRVRDDVSLSPRK
jgi:hypothetical protein